MNDKKLEIFSNHTQKAFKDVISELVSAEFSPCETYKSEKSEKVAIVIGITGNLKGRVLLECDLETASNVAVEMNRGELLDDPNDLYVYMAEFGNMVCGRAVSYMNNEFKGQEVWISPPTIFSGEDLEISTPGIKYQTAFYSGKSGNFILDIGVEGG